MTRYGTNAEYIIHNNEKPSQEARKALSAFLIQLISVAELDPFYPEFVVVFLNVIHPHQVVTVKILINIHLTTSSALCSH